MSRFLIDSLTNIQNGNSEKLLHAKIQPKTSQTLQVIQESISPQIGHIPKTSLRTQTDTKLDYLEKLKAQSREIGKKLLFDYRFSIHEEDLQSENHNVKKNESIFFKENQKEILEANKTHNKTNENQDSINNVNNEKSQKSLKYNENKTIEENNLVSKQTQKNQKINNVHSKLSESDKDKNISKNMTEDNNIKLTQNELLSKILERKNDYKKSKLEQKCEKTFERENTSQSQKIKALEHMKSSKRLINPKSIESAF